MTVTVSVRLEDDVKKELDTLVDDLGITLSSFFTIYAKQAIRERRIPFILSARPAQQTHPLFVSSLEDACAVSLLEEGMKAEQNDTLLTHEEATRLLREDGIIA